MLLAKAYLLETRTTSAWMSSAHALSKACSSALSETATRPTQNTTTPANGKCTSRLHFRPPVVIVGLLDLEPHETASGSRASQETDSAGSTEGGGRGVNEGRTAGSRLVVQTLARSHFAVSVRTRRGRSHCCKPPPSFSEAGVEKCRETLPPSGSELAVGMKLCIERNHRTKRDVRSDADACASDGAS